MWLTRNSLHSHLPSASSVLKADICALLLALLRQTILKWELKHPSINRDGLLHSGDVFNLQIKETLSCAVDRGLDWKLWSPALILFGRHGFSPKMLLSLISGPCPVIASAGTRRSTFIQRVLRMHMDISWPWFTPYQKKKKNHCIQSPLNLVLSFPGIVGYLELVSYEIFFFSYLVNHSVENRVRQGFLVWKVCHVLKPLEMGFCSASLSRYCLSLCFLLIVFGSGQGVYNSHHLGQWKNDSRSLWRVEAFISTSVRTLILCLLNPLCRSGLHTYLQVSDIILA